MPYIKQEKRNELDPHIDQFVIEMLRANASEGDMNYAFTTIALKFFQPKSYTEYGNIIKLLECVKLEYYRECMAVYEDLKKKENGTVFQSPI